MLYPPGWDCSSFTPIVLSRVLCACDGPCALFPESSAPSVSWGLVCCVKSVGGNPQVPRICRNIPTSRQRIDPNDNCGRTTVSRRPGRTRPTNLVSEPSRRRPRVGDTGRRTRKTDAAKRSADYHLQMSDIPDGRSVLERRNERVRAP